MFDKLPTGYPVRYRSYKYEVFCMEFHCFFPESTTRPAMVSVRYKRGDNLWNTETIEAYNIFPLTYRELSILFFAGKVDGKYLLWATRNIQVLK